MIRKLENDLESAEKQNKMLEDQAMEAMRDLRRRPTENKDAEPVIQQDDALIAQKDAEIAEMMAKVMAAEEAKARIERAAQEERESLEARAAAEKEELAAQRRRSARAWRRARRPRRGSSA